MLNKQMKGVGMTKWYRFGERLESAIEKSGCTKTEAAHMMGVSPSAVSMWCKGNRVPSVANLISLCELLGVSADELLGID